MNRCKNSGLNVSDNYLDADASNNLRGIVDKYIDKKMDEWFTSVPYAKHFEDAKIDKSYYSRHLIETIWRIRLLRISESRALSEIAKVHPVAAQIWANYEREEMLHDQLFMQDLASQNVTREEMLATEPYLSTKLLSGFFLYLLEHEGPLGVVAYSYLVEYVNVKLEPKKLVAMKTSIGEQNIRGQVAHAHTDVNDDHPGEVWQVIRYLINAQEDIDNLYRYIDEMQTLLSMYFVELFKDTIENKKKDAA